MAWVASPLTGTSLRSFAYMDVGEGREQDAEALPVLQNKPPIVGRVKRSVPVNTISPWPFNSNRQQHKRQCNGPRQCLYPQD